MTASQPVSSNMRRASSGCRTSPLPITGMLTAFLTSRITLQSALPLKPWARVRAWSARERTPQPSRRRAVSAGRAVASSQPIRILTVTGSGVAATTAATTASMRPGSASSAEPALRSTTLRTGQPRSRSMRSGSRSVTRRAASAMTPGSEPHSWIPNGRSSGVKRIRRRVVSFSRTTPSETTISL